MNEPTLTDTERLADMTAERDHWKAHAEEAGQGFAQVCRDYARVSAQLVNANEAVDRERAAWATKVTDIVDWLERHKSLEDPFAVLEKWDVPTADHQGYLAGLAAANARLRALLAADDTEGKP